MRVQSRRIASIMHNGPFYIGSAIWMENEIWTKIRPEIPCLSFVDPRFFLYVISFSLSIQRFDPIKKTFDGSVFFFNSNLIYGDVWNERRSTTEWRMVNGGHQKFTDHWFLLYIVCLVGKLFGLCISFETWFGHVPSNRSTNISMRTWFRIGFHYTLSALVVYWQTMHSGPAYQAYSAFAELFRTSECDWCFFVHQSLTLYRNSDRCNVQSTSQCDQCWKCSPIRLYSRIPFLEFRFYIAVQRWSQAFIIAYFRCYTLVTNIP